jgi:LacI family transcriptional regulator
MPIYVYLRIFNREVEEVEKEEGKGEAKFSTSFTFWVEPVYQVFQMFPQIPLILLGFYSFHELSCRYAVNFFLGVDILRFLDKDTGMTINDIAEICGVSKGTVNRAIHDKPGINAETKKRILEAVKKYGFKPDYRAKCLATGKTHTIGLMLPNIENQAFAGIAACIEREAWSRGYFLHLALSGDDADKEEQYIEVFRERKIDGLAIFPVNREQDELNKLIAAGIPVVLLMNDLPGLNTASVLLDERESFAQITRYVFSLGHRDIIYLDGYRHYTSRYNDWINRERYAGFRKALHEYGIDTSRINVVEFLPDFYTYSNLGPLSRYFTGTKRPSAAICFHDRMAIWLMTRLAREGISVPADISVTGYDDVAILEDIRPSLTTLHNPYSRLAQTLIHILLAKIEQNDRENSRIVLNADLVVRESCEPVKTKPHRTFSFRNETKRKKI